MNPKQNGKPAAPPKAAPHAPQGRPHAGLAQRQQAEAQQRPQASGRVPAAPPVYRPQSPAACLQKKAAVPAPRPPAVAKPAPAPPPVYRPQPLPKVLQPKAALTQPPPQQSLRNAQHTRDARTQAPAPPRPFAPAGVVQPKTLAKTPTPNPAQARNTNTPPRPPQRPAPPSRPAPPARPRANVVQRWIDYTSSCVYLPVDNRKELIAQLVKTYGEGNRKALETAVDSIEKSEERWTLFDVYRYVIRLGLHAYSEVTFGGSSTKPTLPSGSTRQEGAEEETRYAAINQFAFNTVTRLIGIIGTRKYEFRNETTAKKHAEEMFMEAAERSGLLPSNPRIVITLNNSPCVEKCAGLLERWVRRHRLTHVTIHFANPYGEDEDFSAAIASLKRAGIKVHGFQPLSEIGSDTDDEIEEDYRDRFGKMAVRLRSAKGRKLYVSDEESESSSSSSGSDSDSESESGSESDRGRSRSRSRSPVQRGASSTRGARGRGRGGRGGRGGARSPLKRERSSSPPPRGKGKEEASGRAKRGKRGSGGSSARGRGGKGKGKAVVLAAPAVIPHVGVVTNVIGDGMNCLIRALLFASGHAIVEDTVGLLRDHLVEQHVAVHDTMLNLAGTAGAILVTFMVLNGIIPATRGVRVYSYNEYGVIIYHDVVPGMNPIKLWLSDDHFRAIR